MATDAYPAFDKQNGNQSFPGESQMYPVEKFLSMDECCVLCVTFQRHRRYFWLIRPIQHDVKTDFFKQNDNPLREKAKCSDAMFRSMDECSVLCLTSQRMDYILGLIQYDGQLICVIGVCRYRVFANTSYVMLVIMWCLTC